MAAARRPVWGCCSYVSESVQLKILTRTNTCTHASMPGKECEVPHWSLFAPVTSVLGDQSQCMHANAADLSVLWLCAASRAVGDDFCGHSHRFPRKQCDKSPVGTRKCDIGGIRADWCDRIDNDWVRRIVAKRCRQLERLARVGARRWDTYWHTHAL